MKYLKIENNKGYYWDGDKYQEIDKIGREGLLLLLNAAEEEGFELDAYDASLLENKVHQVIYENIHSKFAQFLTDKDQFKTEVDNLCNEAIGKYSADVQGEVLEDAGDTESVNYESEVKDEDLPF